MEEDLPAPAGEGEVDDIQYGIGEGPCISAAALGQTMRSGSIGGDARWPRFGARANRQLYRARGDRGPECADALADPHACDEPASGDDQQCSSTKPSAFCAVATDAPPSRPSTACENSANASTPGLPSSLNPLWTRRYAGPGHADPPLDPTHFLLRSIRTHRAAIEFRSRKRGPFSDAVSSDVPMHRHCNVAPHSLLAR